MEGMINMSKQEKIFKEERYAHREDLAGEHRIGDIGQLIFFLTFLGVWIMDTFFLKFSTIHASRASLLICIPAGIATLLVAGWLAISGLKIAFGEVRQEPRVIREGVFSIVRHPIYLGAILVYLGLLVFSLSITAALVWLIIIRFYVFLCRYEEKLLIEKYGDDYIAYIHKVPMLLPRFW
jgi:protein-S-isoprenylcysteine O-methyltransferase Ste14